MALDFYYYHSSFFSQKVWLALEEKQIPYNHVLINLPAAEVHTPWYMANVNSNGQVPVIKHGDTYIADSNIIIKYLDKNFGGRTLWPDADTPEGKQIEEFMTKFAKECTIEVLTYGAMCHQDLTDGIQMPGFLCKLAKGAMVRGDKKLGFLAKIKKNPELKEAYEKIIDFWEQFRNQVMDKDNVKQKITECKTFFDYVESIFQKNATDDHADFFLFKREFNIADITLAITLQRLYILGLIKVVVYDGRHPNVVKYYERLLERPSFQKTSVQAYHMTSLLRAQLYFAWRDSKKPLFCLALLGAAGYFAWRYSKSL